MVPGPSPKKVLAGMEFTDSEASSDDDVPLGHSLIENDLPEGEEEVIAQNRTTACG